MIKTLNQLKKVLVPNVEFKIIAHSRISCVSQIRRVTKTTTTGFYSFIPADPQSAFSLGDNGFGGFLTWGPAKNWHFSDDGVCTHYDNISNEIIISFKIIEKE